MREKDISGRALSDKLASARAQRLDQVRDLREIVALGRGGVCEAADDQDVASRGAPDGERRCADVLCSDPRLHGIDTDGSATTTMMDVNAMRDPVVEPLLETSTV